MMGKNIIKSKEKNEIKLCKERKSLENGIENGMRGQRQRQRRRYTYMRYMCYLYVHILGSNGGGCAKEGKLKFPAEKNEYTQLI